LCLWTDQSHIPSQSNFIFLVAIFTWFYAIFLVAQLCLTTTIIQFNQSIWRKIIFCSNSNNQRFVNIPTQTPCYQIRLEETYCFFLCFKHWDLNQDKISAPNMLVTILELHIKIDRYIHCTFTEMWQLQSSLPTNKEIFSLITPAKMTIKIS